MSDVIPDQVRDELEAIGLEFSVPPTADVITVVASWGRYGGTVEVRIDTEGTASLVPDPSRVEMRVRATVRHRGERRIVELSLVNEERVDDKTRLDQAELTVTASDADDVFLGHNDPAVAAPPSTLDDERRHLELLHRATRRYARGRRCAVDAFVRCGETRAWKLATTRFPSAEAPLIGPGQVPGLVLDMARLGSPDFGRDDLFKALRPLVTGYRRWLSVQAARAESDPEIWRYGDAGPRAIGAARNVAGRLARAIELLRTDELAREAFRFANQAMAMRRLDVPENRSWRPFQLAFLLLCLPGLTSPAHPDAARTGGAAEVLLLSFPDGGGKTEAYLGLAAYTFAIRRLRGAADPDGGDGTRGVAVLMLCTKGRPSVQLVQRVSALLRACETLRRERLGAGDSRWGTTPFRIEIAPGDGLPSISGDEEIDRLPPALVIATVDTMARFPWTASWPPDLIIQDELSPCPGPAGIGVRPLLVAGTATPRMPAPGLTVFPPPVLDAGNTYFSVLVPTSPAGTPAAGQR